jgi:DNA mismatch endonuclease, patch repair protein
MKFGSQPKPSSDNARRRMQGTPQRDTPCELAIRAELHKRGVRFRVNAKPLSFSRRTADILFIGKRVAVFVDGCFWHQCPRHGTVPKANKAWWKSKFDANRRRDRDTNKALKSSGWQVVRVWEHQNPVRAANRIIKTLNARKLDDRPRTVGN